jgi:chromosome segregation ATPase
VFVDVESLDDLGTKAAVADPAKLEVVPATPLVEPVATSAKIEAVAAVVSTEVNQVFSPEALVKALEAPLASLHQEVADLKTVIDGSVQKLDKADQTMTKVEERLGKLEAQPVVPPNLALKIQERTSPDAEKAGSRLAIVGEDGKTVTLDELQKRYAEIEAELKRPNLDGKKCEKLETEGFRVARDIKFLLGESVIR